METDRVKLDLFIEELLVQAGFTSLSDEFKLNYKEKLAGQLLERVGLRALLALPDDKAEEYKTMAEAGSSQEELAVFLQANVPDFAKLTEETVKEFASDFIKNTKVNK